MSVYKTDVYSLAEQFLVVIKIHKLVFFVLKLQKVRSSDIRSETEFLIWYGISIIHLR